MYKFTCDNQVLPHSLENTEWQIETVATCSVMNLWIIICNRESPQLWVSLSRCWGHADEPVRETINEPNWFKDLNLNSLCFIIMWWHFGPMSESVGSFVVSILKPLGCVLACWTYFNVCMKYLLPYNIMLFVKIYIPLTKFAKSSSGQKLIFW